MRNDLIRAILDCGIDDLSMLDDAGADMFETIERMRSEGIEITLNSIIGEIFREGIWRFGESVKAFRTELEHQEVSGSMTEASYEQLEKLRSHDINPERDFGYYLNCQDAHLYAAADKQEVYEQELQNLEDYTGFSIKW